MENIKDIQKKNLETVCGIHRIEGFNPQAEAKQMLQAKKGEDEKIKTFLPLMKKKQWFKLALPDGKLAYLEEYPNLPKEMPFKEKQDILNSIDKVVMIVRVYKNASDSKEAFIGEGYGVVYADDAAFCALSAEKKYPEMIKTARGTAESRALYNAGFGLQFYGDEVELLEEIALNLDGLSSTEHPFVPKENKVRSENGYVPQKTDTENPSTATALSAGKNTRRTYQQIYEDAKTSLRDLKKEIQNLCILENTAGTEAERKSIANKLEKLKVQWEKETEAMRKSILKGAKAKEDTELEFDLAVDAARRFQNEKEEINEPKMPAKNPARKEEAMEVLCTFGTYQGRTYGEIYKNQKNMLVWLCGKELPEKEKAAVTALCMQDAELKAKIERM